MESRISKHEIITSASLSRYSVRILSASIQTQFTSLKPPLFISGSESQNDSSCVDNSDKITAKAKAYHAALENSGVVENTQTHAEAPIEEIMQSPEVFILLGLNILVIVLRK